LAGTGPVALNRFLPYAVDANEHEATVGIAGIITVGALSAIGMTLELR
jgi:hypothetical protein